MVNIKSKNLLVLIVEIDENDPQRVIEKLEEKLNISFFTKSGEIPFLIKPKGNVKPEVIEAVIDYLVQKGFTPLLSSERPSKGEREEKVPPPETTIDIDRFTGNRTEVIHRNLRSGQIVEFPGDVVVIGDVNPGAEVRAAGNVIVLGELRGIAWAGYPGNKDAVIVALKMKPQQLRIANIFAPGEGLDDRDNTPKKAKVVQENGHYEIEIEPLL